MAINVVCKQCRSRFSARDELAGESVTCPECKAALTVPGSKGPVAKPAASPEVQFCKKCGVSLTTGQTFCDRCGSQLKKSAAGRRNRRPRRRMSLGQRAHLDAIRKAQHAIFAVVFLEFVGVLLLVIMCLSAGIMPPAVVTAIAMDLVLAGIFLGFGFWSKTNPFAASFAALILFCTPILLGLLVNPASQLSFLGIIIKILVILALVTGMKSALRYRRIEARAQLQTE